MKESWVIRKDEGKMKRAEIWGHDLDATCAQEFLKSYLMNETNIVTPPETQDKAI